MGSRPCHTWSGRRPFRRSPLIAALSLALLLYSSVALCNDKESQVKAAFLINFAKLIEWPAAAFGKNSGLFTICVPSSSPLAELIPSQKGKTTKGRTITWKTYEGFDSAGDCQILYITERRRLPQAIRALGSHPVLMVGEQDGFCQAGGGINLTTSEGRILFEVNLKVLQRLDLKAGAQLLKVAREVIH